MTGPLTALNLAFVNIFNVKGRASRAEFWWATLFVGLVGAVPVIVDSMMLLRLIGAEDPLSLTALQTFDFLTLPYALIVLLPYTTLAIRRLHDIGLSGFWWLVNIVPIVGPVVLFAVYCLPSDTITSVHGTAKMSVARAAGKSQPTDTHKRAMQDYAVLFDKDKPVTQEERAAKKAEISDYYRSRVLKTAPSA